MDKDTQDYFNNYFDMFATEGWKQLIKETENMGILANSVEATTDANDLFFRKGQLQVISGILNLENAVEAAYQQQQQTDENAEG
jgi:hypothetical protein